MISEKRRKNTYKIINKRLKQIRDMNQGMQGIEYIHSNYKDVQQPHRLAKKKAFGCHRSQCRCCHAEKLDDKIQETHPNVEEKK